MADEEPTAAACSATSWRARSPPTVVRESDRVLAFRDIAPRAPTHILLIPKEHIASAADLGRRARRACSPTSTRRRSSWPAPRGSTRPGWRLITNVGPDSGQEVFHLHFHLLGGRPLGPLVSPTG